MTSGTSAAIQICTAEATGKPCGEPVAELGPCVAQSIYTEESCGLAEIEHVGGMSCETYGGTLTHVTLGPCETCGEGHPIEWGGIEPCEGLPTLTERTDLKHEAKVVG